MPSDSDRRRYVFQPRDPSVYCELYFPHKAAYQGAIYKALLDGADPEKVKAYLAKSVDKGLVTDLSAYRPLFNPDLYSGISKTIDGDELARAKARIAQYRSSFAGWSMYTVAGVFFGENIQLPTSLRPTQRLEPAEELVQVLRLIFRFSKRDLDEPGDPLLDAALAANCDEVYRLIVFRTIQRMERVVGLNPWHSRERDRFLAQRRHWKQRKLRHKYEFARRYYSAIAREAEHWLDDCALFVFGFLVRRFGETVLQQREEKQEAEIWVTHFLDLSVNVTARAPQGV